MKVIVGVDGGKQQRDALELADHLALSAEDPEIVVVHVFPWTRSSVHFGPAYAKTIEEDAEAIVTVARGTIARSTTGRTVGAASPARGLIDLCEQEDADLLVLGASHRGPLGRTLLGGSADHVIHGAPCAVAIAPRDYASAAASIGSVAVGYDAGPESEAALAWAVGLAQATSAKLTLMTVVERPPLTVYPGAMIYSATAVVEDQHVRLRELLDAALAGLPAEIEATSLLVDDLTAEALGAATTKHDLLVLGSRGYGPIGNVLLGGVSRRVIHHAECPVVVLPRAGIRPEDRPTVKRLEAATPA